MKFLTETTNGLKLYHNTYPEYLDSILKNGLLVSKSNSELNSGFQSIWATDKPYNMEYGGVTLEITLPSNIRYDKVNEDQYTIYDDIPAKYIKVVDYPILLPNLKLSNIKHYLESNKYSTDKIKEVLLKNKNKLVWNLDRTKELTSFLNW